MSETPTEGGFFAEVQRRKVFRPVIIYVIGCWILLQIADITFEPMGLPDWTLTFVILLAAFGLPVVITLAWVFDVTADGVEVTRTTHQNQLNYLIGILFVGAMGLSAALYFWPKQPLPAIAVAPVVKVQFFGDRKSIAVLPFENLSDGADDAYFASGIHEEILFRVSKIRDLDVKSKTSVMKYIGQMPPVNVIGEEMGVGSVLEGSVRRAGDRVRITVQLIDTATDSHLWAESYNRDLEDIFAIQADVAQSVAGALQATLLPQELLQLEKIPTNSIEAYSFYLRSLSISPINSNDRLELIGLLENALKVDPNYADALARLALIYSSDSSLPDDPEPTSDLVTARRLAERAHEIDPSSSQAQIALGTLDQLEWRWMDALDAYRRATELDPSNAAAWTNYAQMLRAQGRHREAMLAAEQAVRTNPGIWATYQTRVTVYYTAGEYAQALRYAEDGMQLFPEDKQYFCWAEGIIRHYMEMSGVSESQRRCNSWLEGEDRVNWAYLVGWIAALGGDRMLAYEILEEYQEQEKQRFVQPGVYAYLYMGLGEYDKALDYLEKSVDYNLFIPTSFLASSRAFDPLRDMPRFKALLERTNLAQFARQPDSLP